MTLLRCDRVWQIDAYRQGRLGSKDTESLERHLRGCSVCTAQMEDSERLRTLAITLHADGPNELALRRVRVRVLRDAASGIPSSPRASFARMRVGAFVALGAACALVLVVAVAVHRAGRDTSSLSAARAAPAVDPSSQASEPFAGTVVGEVDARFWQTREQRQERVELDEGTVHIHVRPQAPGERFLVAMPDGEIEVRGTTFDVAVKAGETTHVHVESGVVELRLRARPVVRLVDGDGWTLPSVAPASPSPAPLASPLPPKAPAAGMRRSTPSPASVDDGAAPYAAAMTALRDGRYEEAAAAFHAYGVAWPRSSQAEDASFLEAVALARAGRPDAAGLAAERHLESYPASFHKREATILVDRAAALRRPQNP
jgi:hypothetical protein